MLKYLFVQTESGKLRPIAYTRLKNKSITTFVGINSIKRMFGRWKRQIYKITKNKLIQSKLNTINFLPTTENNQAVHNKFI